MTKVTFAIRRDDKDLDVIMTLNNSGERYGSEKAFALFVGKIKNTLEVELKTEVELLHNVCLDVDVYEP